MLSMARLSVFLDSNCQLEGSPDATSILLSPRESHHLAVVLRARPGDPVLALDGQGSSYHTLIDKLGKRQVRLAITSVSHSSRPTPEIILLPALLKGKSMEALLRAAAEVGVSRIIPLLTEHVEGGAREPKPKWSQILQESLKQCGNDWLPVLQPALRLPEAVDTVKIHAASGCVAALTGSRETLWHHLAKQADHPPNSFFLFIGPEGDFSAQEYRLLQDAEIPAVTLGANILRAETAATVASGMAIAALRT